MDTVPKVSSGIVWRAMKTVPVPTEIGVAAVHYAGKVSGMFRARNQQAHHGWHGQCLALVGVLHRKRKTRRWSLSSDDCSPEIRSTPRLPSDCLLILSTS